MESFFAGLAGIAVGAFLGLLVQRRLQKNDQAERLTAARRPAYGDFLDAAYELALAIQQAHRDRLASTRDVPPEAFGRRIDEISPHRGQMTLERLRLVATTETAAKATVLWDRLRRDAARKNATLTSKGLDDWVAGYWIAEKDFLNAARDDMGLPALAG
jgi:hypothetical protein